MNGEPKQTIKTNFTYINNPLKLKKMTTKQTTAEQVKRYKVYKIGRKYGMSGRRQLLGKNLTQEEARRIVNSYPDSSRSMVIYTSY